MGIIHKIKKPIYNAIQGKHLDDFFKIRTDFIKSRVRLLCSLTILIYFVTLGIWLLLDPSKFTPLDISIGVLLVLASAVVLGFNRKITTFNGARYNSLVIDSVPEDFTLLAWDNKKEIMAIHHDKYPLFGVQFHPESFLTEEGDKLMKNFLYEV